MVTLLGFSAAPCALALWWALQNHLWVRKHPNADVHSRTNPGVSTTKWSGPTSGTFVEKGPSGVAVGKRWSREGGFGAAFEAETEATPSCRC